MREIRAFGKGSCKSFDCDVRRYATLFAQRADNGKCGSKSNGRSNPYGMTTRETGTHDAQGLASLMARGSAFALPGARSDGVVLPFLAAAYEEHDEAEDEHDGSPGEVEVDAHGFFVDAGGVAGEEAVEAHETSDEEEDEA